MPEPQSEVGLRCFRPQNGGSRGGRTVRNRVGLEEAGENSADPNLWLPIDGQRLINSGPEKFLRVQSIRWVTRVRSSIPEEVLCSIL